MGDDADRGGDGSAADFTDGEQAPEANLTGGGGGGAGRIRINSTSEPSLLGVASPSLETDGLSLGSIPARDLED